MLSNLSKILPTASLVALFILAIFNIGYFAEVGLHFLGLIDFTNIVYTFALTFGLLLFAIMILGTDFLENVRQMARVPGVFEKFEKATLVIIVLSTCFLMVVLFADNYVSFLISWRAALVILLFIIFVACSIREYFRFYARSKISYRGATFSAFVGTLLLLSAGRFAAYQQMNSHFSFTITGEHIAMGKARLIRSSSAGFIVFNEGSVIFLPMSSIREIKANERVSP